MDAILKRKLTNASNFFGDVFILGILLGMLYQIKNINHTLIYHLADWLLKSALAAWLIVIIVIRVQHWRTVKRTRKLDEQGTVDE